MLLSKCGKMICLPLLGMVAFKDRSLMFQLLVLSSGMIIVCFVLLGTISIPYAKTISSNINTLGSETLKGSANDKFDSVISNAAKLLALRYNVLISDYLYPIVHTVGWYYQSGAETMFDPQVRMRYYDWPTMMPPDKVYDARYNSLTSFAASSYNVYNYTPADMHRFPSSLNDTIIRTSELDFIFLTGYSNIYQSIYVADVKHGFIREYPATSTRTMNPSDAELNSLKNYDPRREEWFINAMNNPRAVAISLPYYDQYTKNMVVTVSKVYFNLTSGYIMGVAGCDISLEDLIKDLNSINFYKSRKSIIDVGDNMVIANTSTVDGELITSGVNFYVYGNEYLLEVAVLKSDLYSVAQVLIDRVQDIDSQYNLLIGILFPTILILTLLSVSYFVYRLISPLNRLKKISQDAIANYGANNNVFRGTPANGAEPKSSVAEIAELERKLHTVASSYGAPPPYSAS